jgi:hypothetical protein
MGGAIPMDNIEAPTTYTTMAPLSWQNPQQIFWDDSIEINSQGCQYLRLHLLKFSSMQD